MNLYLVSEESGAQRGDTTFIFAFILGTTTCSLHLMSPLRQVSQEKNVGSPYPTPNFAHCMLDWIQSPKVSLTQKCYIFQGSKDPVWPVKFDQIWFHPHTCLSNNRCKLSISIVNVFLTWWPKTHAIFPPVKWDSRKKVKSRILYFDFQGIHLIPKRQAHYRNSSKTF